MTRRFSAPSRRNGPGKKRITFTSSAIPRSASSTRPVQPTSSSTSPNPDLPSSIHRLWETRPTESLRHHGRFGDEEAIDRQRFRRFALQRRPFRPAQPNVVVRRKSMPDSARLDMTVQDRPSAKSQRMYLATTSSSRSCRAEPSSTGSSTSGGHVAHSDGKFSNASGRS